MNSDLLAFVWPLAFLILVVLGLAIYRSVLARTDDTMIHVRNDVAMIPEQVTHAHQLEKVDRWGKTLTVLALVYALVLAGIHLYKTFTASAPLY